MKLTFFPFHTRQAQLTFPKASRLDPCSWHEFLSREGGQGDEPSYHRGLIAGSHVPVEAVRLGDEEVPGTVVTGRVERVLGEVVVGESQCYGVATPDFEQGGPRQELGTSPGRVLEDLEL